MKLTTLGKLNQSVFYMLIIKLTNLEWLDFINGYFSQIFERYARGLSIFYECTCIYNLSVFLLVTFVILENVYV